MILKCGFKLITLRLNLESIFFIVNRNRWSEIIYFYGNINQTTKTMKAKRMMIILGLALGLITLMSSECNNSEPVNPDCNGIIAATTTGFFNEDFCFDVLVTYEFKGVDGIDIVARQEGAIEYAFAINLYGYNGPGTYNLGQESHGFAELILHGNDNEFYKVQSGTVSITEADASTMKATFSIVTVGYYNEQTVNISGSIDKK